MIRWHVCNDPPIPAAVECDPPGWPHTDAEGRPQYVNTHFDTEAQAWEKAKREAEARVHLANGELRRAQDYASKAEAELLAAQEALITVYQAWGRSDVNRAPER